MNHIAKVLGFVCNIEVSVLVFNIEPQRSAHIG
jgi:hypothetical protein